MHRVMGIGALTVGLLAVHAVGCTQQETRQEVLEDSGDEEAVIAEGQQALTTTYTLTWPSNLGQSGNVCQFGDTAAGNQAATQNHLSGRLEEPKTPKRGR